MKKLDYATEEHTPKYDYCDSGSPKYAIDWDRNEERFKVVGKGMIRVYQGGRVEIIHTPYRDPGLKRLLFKSYDVDFRLPKDTQGIKFFTPDGRPVIKKHIRESIIFLDHEHKMALAGRRFHYAEHGYAPKSNKQISVKLWRPAIEAEFLEKWGDTLKLGVTVDALATVAALAKDDKWTFTRSLLSWLRNPKPLDPIIDKKLLELLGVVQSSTPNQFAAALREVCAKVETFDYLRIEEK